MAHRENMSVDVGLKMDYDTIRSEIVKCALSAHDDNRKARRRYEGYRQTTVDAVIGTPDNIEKRALPVVEKTFSWLSTSGRGDCLLICRDANSDKDSEIFVTSNSALTSYRGVAGVKEFIRDFSQTHSIDEYVS